MYEKTFTKVIRIIFAIVLIFFGLNVFFQFMPAPEFEGVVAQVFGGFIAAKYIFPTMAIVFLISGLLFLINRCSPFAAILIVPFSLNFILFHIFVAWAGWYMALIFAVFNAYLIGAYWQAYKPMCE